MIPRPTEIVSLIRADALNIARDPIMVIGALFSIVPGIILYFASDAIDQAALDAFGLNEVSRLIASVALVLPGAMLGWVAGFLLLEDRDENVLLALDVTPIGKTGFIAYRLATCFAATLVVVLATALLALPEFPPLLLLPIALIAAGHGVTVALFLLAFAANKVEGLALTKLVNILMLAPLIALIPGPARFIGGLLPPYWIGELLAFSSAPLMPALAFPLGLLTLVLTTRLLTYRIGRKG